MHDRLRHPALGMLAVLLATGGCRETPEPASEHTGAAAVARTAHPPKPRPTAALAPDTACISAGCHESFARTRHVHAVALAPNGCASCHEDDTGGHVYPLRRTGNDTCTFCHDSVTGQREHHHAAVDIGCLTCHDPHGTDHPAMLLTASSAALCGTCHPAVHHDIEHAPFALGECTACHEPHESDFAHLTRGGEGNDHCFECHAETHDALARGRFVHEPATLQCQLCHAPHGAAFPHLMHDRVDQTCFSCHEDIEASLADVSAPHGAMRLDDQCANCHDAHASDQPHLLKQRQDEICLSCHDTAITAADGREIPDMTDVIRNRTFRHGPVESGNCSACHSVHGGTHSRLLREHFTDDFYTSFDLGQYALCFSCHESALVTEERTESLTNFRNGDQNLHYLHVNRDRKGRSCRACHEVHGSDLPAHIADSVPFGDSGWPLPIRFEQTPTGGSCAPGCHKPYRYDRITPILGDDS